MSGARPEVGAWYQTRAGDYLEVVAVDPDDGTIGVQYYDGTVEEYDRDGWQELAFSDAEPPEDWSGSLDVNRDDYGVDLDRPGVDFLNNPLDYVDSPDLDLDLDLDLD